MRHALYKLTAPDGREYIGMTIRSLDARLYGHMAQARHIDGANAGPGTILKAFRELGEDGWGIEQVASAQSRDDARQMEAALIEAHGTRYPRGMNKLVYKPRPAPPADGRDWIIPVGSRSWPPPRRFA